MIGSQICLGIKFSLASELVSNAADGVCSVKRSDKVVDDLDVGDISGEGVIVRRFRPELFLAIFVRLRGASQRRFETNRRRHRIEHLRHRATSCPRAR